jgi:hypothetical protein
MPQSERIKKKTLKEREEHREAMYGDYTKSSWYRALNSILRGYPPGLQGRHPYLLPEELTLLLQQIRLRTLASDSPPIMMLEQRSFFEKFILFIDLTFFLLFFS